jgi:Ca2+:H+ antiporter
MPAHLRPTLNWLLVFIPISLVFEFAVHQPVALFITACLAIVPLAGILSKATEQLAIRSGPRVGGLLNATFGNVTEMIISVMLIIAGQFEVVKASLIGSILGNLVLVLGAALFAGGLRFKQQRFSGRSASTHAASLLMAVTGLALPTVFVLAAPDTGLQRMVVSVGVAAILIALYVANLVFSLVTHAHLFRSTSVQGQAEAPSWSATRAVLVLLAAAVVVGIESEFLVSSLEPTVVALGISKLFIGLFVVAIIGNAAEHAAAVMFALRNKLDISIEIAFGSSTQIALFVAPALVFVSLIVARPMDFIFLPIEVVAVGLSTLIAAFMTMDGRSNWLEGMQLLGAYVIMAVSFFFVRGALG